MYGHYSVQLSVKIFQNNMLREKNFKRNKIMLWFLKGKNNDVSSLLFGPLTAFLANSQAQEHFRGGA